MERVDAFKSFGRLMGREEKKKAVCFEEMLKEVMKDAKNEREGTKLLTKRVAINLISFTLKTEESKQPASSSFDLFDLFVPKRKRRKQTTRLFYHNTNRRSFNDSDNNSGEEKEDDQEGRKFRRIEEEKSRKPKKKLMKKEDRSKPNLEGVPMPDMFRSKIEELDGGDMKLILEKTLTQTDMESWQGKLSIPINQVLQKFLEPQEERLLEQIGDDGRRRKGIDVAFIEPSGKVCTNMVLKRWPMKRGGLFALNQGWNGVVERNKGPLKVGAKVHVWSFRTIKSKQLGFALVVVD